MSWAPSEMRRLGAEVPRGSEAELQCQGAGVGSAEFMALAGEGGGGLRESWRDLVGMHDLKNV